MFLEYLIVIFSTFFFKFSFFSSFFDYVSILLDPPTHHVHKRKHLAYPTHPPFCLRNFEISLKTYLWLILIPNDHNTPIFPVQKASNSFLFWRCKDCCYHTPFCAIPPSVFWNCLYCDDCTVVKFSQIWRKGSKWQPTEFLARSSLRHGLLYIWTELQYLTCPMRRPFYPYKVTQTHSII